MTVDPAIYSQILANLNVYILPTSFASPLSNSLYPFLRPYSAFFTSTLGMLQSWHP